MKKLVFVGTIQGNWGKKSLVFWFFPGPGENNLITIKKWKVFSFMHFDSVEIERAEKYAGELVALIGKACARKGLKRLCRLWIKENVIAIQSEMRFSEIERKIKEVLKEIFGDIFEFKNVPHGELHSDMILVP